MPTHPAADALWRRDSLREMVNFELRVARVIDGEVTAFAEAPRAEDSHKVIETPARAMNHTARARRVGLMLHERLGEDREVRLARPAREAERRAQAREDRDVAQKRDLIHAAVEGAIQAQHSLDDLDGQPKARGLRLRLDREAADRETFLDRPAAEIIVRLCRDLKLSPDWRRWDTAWAREAERTAVPPWRRPAADPAEPRDDALPDPIRRDRPGGFAARARTRGSPN